MKRKLLVSLIVLSMFGLAGCAGSGDDVNQQTPPPAEQGQDVEGSEDAAEGDTGKFVYDPQEVKELNLDIDLRSGGEWEYDFDRNDNEAEIEFENGSDIEREGSEAFQEIEGLLSAMTIDLDRPINEMIEEILSHVKIQRGDLKEIDFEIEMFSGEKVGFKYHIGENTDADAIDEFEMDIEFKSGVEWEYEYELTDSEFDIEYSDKDDLSGQNAKNEIERILSEVTIGLDKSVGGMKQEFFTAVDVNENDVKEWHFEIEYQTGEKIKAKQGS